MEKIYKKSFTECETEFAQMDNYKWSLEFGKINSENLNIPKNLSLEPKSESEFSYLNSILTFKHDEVDIFYEKTYLYKKERSDNG